MYEPTVRIRARELRVGDVIRFENYGYRKLSTVLHGEDSVTGLWTGRSVLGKTSFRAVWTPGERVTIIDRDYYQLLQAYRDLSNAP